MRGGSRLETSDWILPDWPAPASVHAVSTTRAGGVSRGPYASFNLGAHVDDDSRAVAENRLALRSELNLPVEPCWLKQVHGTRVVTLEDCAEVQDADGAVTRHSELACVIMTADCLPVLFCDRAGHAVAAAHAGWRGLAAGVLENTLAAMHTDPAEILAWLGPAIGPQVYEVGETVRAAFVAADRAADQAFEPHGAGKWLCDLYQLASRRLKVAGVTRIYGGGLCTYSDPQRFFSCRRDGQCGRMATLTWLQD
ncbi:MAG: peptidoglycan editing factor PgeF [Gammaproteobacteria bacterium]